MRIGVTVGLGIWRSREVESGSNIRGSETYSKILPSHTMSVKQNFPVLHYARQVPRNFVTRKSVQHMLLITFTIHIVELNNIWVVMYQQRLLVSR